MHLHYLEFKFSSASDRWEAFKGIGRPAVNFENLDQLIFGKAMGTGSGNGFSVIPSFSKYAFLVGFKSDSVNKQAVWDSKTFCQYKERAESFLHVIGKPVKSHGKWEGDNPFDVGELNFDSSRPIAVITRATIRTRKLLEFWSNVPKTSRFMFNHPAALYQTGIGEYPLFMQATFSIWKSRKELFEAAYSNTVHGEIVKKTRERNWYKEELFAEFSIEHLENSGSFYPSELNSITQV